MRKLRSITEKQQFAFATAKALTATAVQVQGELKRNMPGRFTLRRDWIVKGIRIRPATKGNLQAFVYSRDKFMGRQETGGEKSPLRNYLAVPITGSSIKRTKTGLIAKSNKPKNIKDTLYAKGGGMTSVITVQSTGRKYIVRLKKNAGKKDRLDFLYALVPRAQIKERLGLGKDGMRVARAKFVVNLRDALEAALRSAR